MLPTPALIVQSQSWVWCTTSPSTTDFHTLTVRLVTSRNSFLQRNKTLTVILCFSLAGSKQGKCPCGAALRGGSLQWATVWLTESLHLFTNLSFSENCKAICLWICFLFGTSTEHGGACALTEAQLQTSHCQPTFILFLQLFLKALTYFLHCAQTEAVSFILKNEGPCQSGHMWYAVHRLQQHYYDNRLSPESWSSLLTCNWQLRSMCPQTICWKIK